jgi:hypothetical protein
MQFFSGSTTGGLKLQARPADMDGITPAVPARANPQQHHDRCRAERSRVTPPPWTTCIPC